MLKLAGRAASEQGVLSGERQRTGKPQVRTWAFTLSVPGAQGWEVWRRGNRDWPRTGAMPARTSGLEPLKLFFFFSVQSLSAVCPQDGDSGFLLPKQAWQEGALEERLRPHGWLPRVGPR